MSIYLAQPLESSEFDAIFIQKISYLPKFLFSGTDVRSFEAINTQTIMGSRKEKGNEEGSTKDP